MFLEVVEYGDYAIDLDALDYKKYIHIRYKQVHKTFEDGVMQERFEFFKYERCTEENY